SALLILDQRGEQWNRAEMSAIVEADSNCSESTPFFYPSGHCPRPSSGVMAFARVVMTFVTIDSSAATRSAARTGEVGNRWRVLLGTIWGPHDLHAGRRPARQPRVHTALVTCLTCGDAYFYVLGVKGSQVQILSSRPIYGARWRWVVIPVQRVGQLICRASDSGPHRRGVVDHNVQAGCWPSLRGLFAHPHSASIWGI